MATIHFPLSRIEGHAKVVVDIAGNAVKNARFLAMEYRGFEQFVRGIESNEMPVIVPRVCGVCATAHHIAAIKALEDAYSITPPPEAETIRHLLLVGQLVQNQATSLFFFTLPDRLNQPSLFESKENKSDIGKRAMAVRQIGTELIGLAGGQFIHPIKAVIGGVTGGIGPEAAKNMREKIIQILPIARELVAYYWDLTSQSAEHTKDWDFHEPCFYMAATDPSNPTHTYERVRMLSDDGTENFEFPATEYEKYLQFHEVEDSYAEKSSCRSLPIRANSLARINMTKSMGTPIADLYFERFKKEFGSPAHHILLFDLCRGIELINALEQAEHLLDQDLHSGDFSVSCTPDDGVGYGMVEAPRGPLIHQYEIENGLIKAARFIIPTVHNNFSIERALTAVAARFVQDGQIDMELEQAVGWVVRAFDPCIACATH
jgi:coenzyme F420-reducing hydrogenase alpha subunit